MPPTEQAQWFSEHVQPYEPALRAYLHKRFPALPDHDDLVQETYAKAVRAREAGRLTHAKAFLFTTARNAAIDLFRRRRGLAHDEISEITALPLLDEAPTAEESHERAERLEVLLEAMLALPERCRQVMMLRHLDGLAYKEIAARLGISPETVKVHMIKGVKDCTRHFRTRGLLAVEDRSAGRSPLAGDEQPPPRVPVSNRPQAGSSLPRQANST
jgi:RNA polymerase sigma factor (sigma-70 family)